MDYDEELFEVGPVPCAPAFLFRVFAKYLRDSGTSARRWSSRFGHPLAEEWSARALNLCKFSDGFDLDRNGIPIANGTEPEICRELVRLSVFKGALVAWVEPPT